MQQRLAPHAEARRQICVRIPRKQSRLKKHERGRPDGRRSAKPWQDLLRDDRLHEEQQERRQEYRARVRQDDEAGTSVGRRGRYGHGQMLAEA